MIPFIVICVLALVLWLLIWSIVSAGKIGELKSTVSRLEAHLTGQIIALDKLSREISGLRADVPPRTETTAPPSVAPVALPPIIYPVAPLQPAAVPVAASAAPAPPPPPTAPGPDELTMPPFIAPGVLVPPPLPAAERPPPAPAEPPSAAINWEQFMGVKLFAWIGGLALFLGVGFFVKLSFENNWITPVMRVTLGFLTGAGLLAGGMVISRRAYRVTSQTLGATGVVILYAVTYACHSIYHFPFFGPLPTFLLMMIITATAGVIAAAREAQVVALLGMLGGFLTPVLLSTGVDNPLGLFGYIALLDAGLLAVALYRRWHYLGLLAAVGTAVMEFAWVADFFTAAKIHTALNVFLGFDGLFLLAFALARRRGSVSRWLAGAAAGVAFGSLGFAFYLLDVPVVAGQPGLLFAFILGADLCLLVLALLDGRLARLHVAAGSLAFLLLAAWMGAHISNVFLPWSLGACLVFAGLHTAFPLVLGRRRPGAAPAWWAHLFPPVALVLVLLTIVRLPEISFLVWPLVLAVDLLAIGAALLTGTLVAVAATLVLTLLATGVWMLGLPADPGEVPTLLFLAGGFGGLFFAAGVYGLRKLATLPAAGAENPAWLRDPAGAGHLSALSALLPFLLLIMIVLRMPLAGPSAVYGLALALTVLVLGLAWMLEDGVLPLVALGCTALLEYVWLEHGFTPGGALVTLLWNLGFYAVFALFPFAFRRRFSTRLLPWVAAALAAPLHFLLVYEVVRRAWPNDYMGLVPAVFALPALAGLAGVLRSLPAGAPRRLDVLAWFGGVALFFITLVFPIQFERQWITLGWALEGAALLWLFHRLPHGGLRLAGVGLLIAAFARLALNPAVLDYHPRAATPILNWYLYAYGLTTSASSPAPGCWRRRATACSESNAPAAL